MSRKPHWPPPIPLSERRRGRPVTPLIDVPDEGLGQHMLALSPAQRAFVTAKVTFGVSNAKAARMAGYSAASPHSADVQGSRLAHNGLIQAATLEEGQKLARSEGPKSSLRFSKFATTKTRKRRTASKRPSNC